MPIHTPTPHARRVAALRYQAERLVQDAAAWGLTVSIGGGRVYVDTPCATICRGPGNCPHVGRDTLAEPCKTCHGVDPLPF